MSEWSKVYAWKAYVPKRYRGFKSLSLRIKKYCVFFNLGVLLCKTPIWLYEGFETKRCWDKAKALALRNESSAGRAGQREDGLEARGRSRGLEGSGAYG